LPQDPQLYHGTWLNGGACYWVFGRCIGEMQYTVPLCDVMLLLENINKRTSFQCEKDFFYADARQILQVMIEDFENEVDDSVKEKNCFGFKGTFDFWRGYDIRLELDIMDDYIVLLLEHETQARLIVGKLGENRDFYEFQSEHTLHAGEVQAVLHEAFGWLQERYQQEVINEKNCPLALGIVW